MNTRQLETIGSELGDATLTLAVAGYLARYKDQSRVHTESDLLAFLR